MSNPSPKLLELPRLLALRETWRAAGQSVVWTNGCFDLLHVGHVRSLEAARRLGDILVVGVNSDESVRQLKGEGRPILPALERAELLAALTCVDGVVIFGEETPEMTLALLKPDVHCKGAEYAPPNGRPIPEQAVVESYGGRVAFLPLLPGLSTSGLVERIRALPTGMRTERSLAAAPVFAAPATVPPPLDAFAGKRILIVGDVMLDEYIWGAVQRISPEAPVPVVAELQRSDRPGGAANAAVNISSLGGQADLLGVIGADEPGARLCAALRERHVASAGLLSVPGLATTTKTRIIAQGQQVVRVDRETASAIPADVEARLRAAVLKRLEAADACVLSDYAKGTLTPDLCQHVIAQARALGKPVIADPKGDDLAKYRGVTLAKPNLHEAERLLKRRLKSNEDVTWAGETLLAALECVAVLITRGAAGMVLFRQGQASLYIPASAREVFDVTGAGDTVIGTLALALCAGATPEEAAHLASRAAALAVSRVGATAVRQEELAAALVNTGIAAQS